MPGLGTPIIWTEDDIIQQSRKTIYERPIPTKHTIPTTSQKSWTVPILIHYGKYFNYILIIYISYFLIFFL